MTPPSGPKRFWKGISSVIFLAVGSGMLFQILLRHGAFNIIILVLFGTMLISSGIFGFVTENEVNHKAVTVQRYRSLAALHLATSAICYMCAVAAGMGIILIQTNGCDHAYGCANYMALDIADSYGQSMLLLVDGVTALVFAIFTAVQASRTTGHADLLSKPATPYPKCTGVLVDEKASDKVELIPANVTAGPCLIRCVHIISMPFGVVDEYSAVPPATNSERIHQQYECSTNGGHPETVKNYPDLLNSTGDAKDA